MTAEEKQRCEDALCFTFRGMHHVQGLKHEERYVSCICGHISTYDFDVLTRFVLACHKYHVRGDVGMCNPQYIRLSVSPRLTEGSIMERHPGLLELAKRCAELQQENK